MTMNNFILKLKAKSFLTTLALSVLSIGTSVNVLAEGSRNLTPDSTASYPAGTASNNWVGFLQHDDGANSGSFLKPSTASGYNNQHRLYVRLQAGDTLYYGVRRINTNTGTTQGNLTIVLRRSNGTQVSSNTLNRNTSSTNQVRLRTDQNGVILNYARCSNGPNTLNGRVTNGYSPLSYINTTNVSQDFYIEFIDAAGDIKSWYDLWDFTVYNGTERTGRLYSKYWSFTGGAQPRRLSANFNLFVAAPDVSDSTKFFVKRINLANVDPFGFIFCSNEFGTTTGSDRTTYRQSAPSNSIYPQYKVFVNDPDNTLYPSTIPSDFYANHVTVCRDAATTAGSVVFTIYSSRPGQVIVFIDRNGTTGYQPGTSDVYIENYFSTAGLKNVYWDGRDGLGVDIPSGTNLQIIYQGQYSNVNFPMFDPEFSTGYNIYNVRPGVNSAKEYMYWDDRNLNASLTTFTPRSQLIGTLTDNVHTWGSSEGNNLTINSWTFGEVKYNISNIVFTVQCDGDNDGKSTVGDIDWDNDGIVNSVECGGVDPIADNDADLIPNYLDVDNNGLTNFDDINRDGLYDILDADLDGIPNFLDTDSDNDGLTDVTEGNNGTVLASNYNAAGGYITGAVSSQGVPLNRPSNTYTDFDGDGVPDFLDLDSDNDGIYDWIEVQGSNASTRAPFGTDGDQDGIDDRYDSDASGGAIPTAHNADGQGFPNQKEADADNDGITDVIENNSGIVPSSNYVASIGRYSCTVNYRGLLSCVTYSNSIVDFDADLIYNAIDFDSDNDGIRDLIESQARVFTNPANVDSDADGIDNNFESNTARVPVNTDATDTPDFLDLNADNDTQLDWVEAYDVNRNGISRDDYRTRATNFETARSTGWYLNSLDSDGNSTPNYLENGANSVAQFLIYGNSFYRDANLNGVADLVDGAVTGGLWIAPTDRNTNNIEDYREGSLAIPLPVKLLNFDGERVSETPTTVNLVWSTASEINNKEFIVERSIDGINYYAIGTVTGNGSTQVKTNYSFDDLNAPASTIYYRLHQFDYNGDNEYHKVEVVSAVNVATMGTNFKLNTEVKIWPNPVANTEKLHLQVSNTPEGYNTITVINMQGAAVSSTSYYISNQSSNVIDLNIESLNAGLYMVNIVTANGESVTKRVIIK